MDWGLNRKWPRRYISWGSGGVCYQRKGGVTLVVVFITLYLLSLVRVIGFILEN